MTETDIMHKIKLGISACLLGHPVRYDSQEKLDHFLRDTLGQYIDFVPVCPEVGIGLGVPRETMHLEGDPASPRMVTIETRIDHTDRMSAWAHKRVKALEAQGVLGFIFKSKSPSCGVERVKVFNDKGAFVRAGTGLFAATFKTLCPLLPIEDEVRLQDPNVRENFIERVFVLQRWRTMLAEAKSHDSLVAFHSAHKLLLLSHSATRCRQLDELVARGHEIPREPLISQYERLLLQTLALPATRRKHVTVLRRILGAFKMQLDSEEKQELREVLDQFANGLVPLLVPVTLLNHFVRKHGAADLATQVYLHPHPLEWRLRYHA